MELSQKWVEYFMLCARCARTLSRDPSTKVGAVIVNTTNRTIVATGYNGFPRGVADTTARYEHRPTKLRYTVHAELNAIINAAANGARVTGCALFVTLPPCIECAKAIIQSGIARVYYYSDPDIGVPKADGGDLGKWRELYTASAIMMMDGGVELVPVPTTEQIII